MPDERPPPPPPSHAGPLVAIGAGAALLGAGGYFLYYGLIASDVDRSIAGVGNNTDDFPTELA